MNIIICIDDKNGIAFNKRRQSRDKCVADKILEFINTSKLYITNYSAELFEPSDQICVVGNVFEAVSENDYVFIELTDVPADIEVDELYIFRWNRHYPSDVKFTFDLSNYELTHSEDFAGSSHDNITLEIYTKREKQ